MKLQRLDGSTILDMQGSVAKTVRHAIGMRMNLTEAVFKDLDLTGIDFKDANLCNADFQSCKLDGCNFSGANLRNAEFYRCKAELAVFKSMEMRGVVFHAGRFTACDFTGVKASDIKIKQTYFTCCDFDGLISSHTLKCEHARFRNCDMRDMVLGDVRAKRSYFVACDVSKSTVHKLDFVTSVYKDCKHDGFKYTAAPMPIATLRKEVPEVYFRAAEWAIAFDKMRHKRGWTIQWVSLATGIEARTLQAMASGGGTDSIDDLIALCRLYNITLGDLPNGDKDHMGRADESGQNPQGSKIGQPAVATAQA